MRFIDAQLLAAYLAERLNRSVPEHVRVDVQRGEMTFALAGEVREWLSFSERFAVDQDWRTAADSAVWNILDKLQDFVISEAGIQPWPDRYGHARAEVRVTEDQIRFWYGDESDPALAFDPIRIADAKRLSPGD